MSQRHPQEGRGSGRAPCPRLGSRRAPPRRAVPCGGPLSLARPAGSHGGDSQLVAPLGLAAERACHGPRATPPGGKPIRGSDSPRTPRPPPAFPPGQLGGPGAASPAAPPGVGRLAGCVSAAAGGRGVKFTVSGGGRVRGGGFVSPPRRPLAQSRPRKGKWGGVRREGDGACGSGLACGSSGVTRRGRGGRDPDHLPAGLSQAPHAPAAGRGGLGRRPAGCGSCCFSVCF